ncbi:hypothetical protein PRUPE_4G105800 [Prunus persica]|uniref:Gamma-tubulin complex component n=1 Tax=Prunus persica TaxID=3760 RepID=A0A251PIP5_PRUPE|nr:uncharacterized protein LOC117623819 isoform X2 [Prunus dulcis]ONI11418.1 hypothetical protein PRUPE_4G105800 [Prunus persica]
MEGILGQNRLEDVSWLCSLSESELDMLISLKSIVLQRARMIGHEELANNFDLKMLRALAFVLMECIRDKVKDLTLAESAAFMESCNLLKYNLGDIMSLEEIRACIGINSRKGPIKRSVLSCQKDMQRFSKVKNVLHICNASGITFSSLPSVD